MRINLIGGYPGIYQFPKELAARIAINTVLKFIRENNHIEKVLFVCFGDDSYQIYSQLLKQGGFNI